MPTPKCVFNQVMVGDQIKLVGPFWVELFGLDAIGTVTLRMCLAGGGRELQFRSINVRGRMDERRVPSWTEEYRVEKYDG